MKITVNKSLKIRWIITAVALVLLLVAGISAKLSVGFANWYGENVYPILVGIFARISGLFPFSLAEIVITLAILTCLFAIVYFIVQLIRKKGRRLQFLLSSVTTVAMVLSIVGAGFMYSCGINYYRTPFSEYSGIEIRPYTADEVRETLVHIIENTNRLIDEVDLDENGQCVPPENLLNATTAAMYKLADGYPVLESYYPNAKPVLASPLMCYTGIVGIFTPYTMEANYNTRDTPEKMGHTICHELSHLTGFLREDEANFISYLACRGSGETYLEYSGYYSALGYMLNAYYKAVGYDEYVELLSTVDPRVYRQICLESEFWAQYDTPVAEVSSAVNDTYLKINDQSDGTKSYGRVVDLIIGEYLISKA